jgi:hypothetical protein
MIDNGAAVDERLAAVEQILSVIATRRVNGERLTPISSILAPARR